MSVADAAVSVHFVSGSVLGSPERYPSLLRFTAIRV